MFSPPKGRPLGGPSYARVPVGTEPEPEHESAGHKQYAVMEPYHESLLRFLCYALGVGALTVIAVGTYRGSDHLLKLHNTQVEIIEVHKETGKKHEDLLGALGATDPPPKPCTEYGFCFTNFNGNDRVIPKPCDQDGTTGYGQCHEPGLECLNPNGKTICDIAKDAQCQCNVPKTPPVIPKCGGKKLIDVHPTANVGDWKCCTNPVGNAPQSTDAWYSIAHDTASQMQGTCCTPYAATGNPQKWSVFYAENFGGSEAGYAAWGNTNCGGPDMEVGANHYVKDEHCFGAGVPNFCCDKSAGGGAGCSTSTANCKPVWAIHCNQG